MIRLRLSLGFLCATTLLSACSEREAILEGQAGTPFSIAAEDGRDVPRAAVRLAECEGTPGGCSSYCTDTPDACAVLSPDACQLALVDSGSPFTMLAQGDSWSVERACLEVRASPGLASSEDSSDPDAVARLRFKDAPVLYAPTSADEWGWEVGDERAQMQHTPVVIGGNLMSEFAVKFRDEAPAPAGTVDISFAKTFPGTEDELASAGSVYLKLQYPSRLSGGQLDDQCGFDGTNCNLPELSLSTGQFVSLLKPHRMAMDVCVAPPPCTMHYDHVASAFDEAPTCRASPSRVSNEACVSADDPARGGRNATMVVATGIPGAALVADSAALILGPLDLLPACADLTAPIPDDVRACVVTSAGAFALPGWPRHEGLTVLQVRAFGVVGGNSDAKGPGACDRLQQRLRGLLSQCIETLVNDSPWAPPVLPEQRVDTGVTVVGEVAYAPGASSPDPDRWIRTIVLPPDLPFVNFSRRDSGTDAAQVDGFLGTALLEETELVLDYTEDLRPPGLRIKCLRPGGGSCLSVPACEASSSTTSGQSAVGSVSCCHGLPQPLLASIVRPDGDQLEPSPRIEDRCCTALGPALRDSLVDDYGACAGQPRL